MKRIESCKIIARERERERERERFQGYYKLSECSCILRCNEHGNVLEDQEVFQTQMAGCE